MILVDLSGNILLLDIVCTGIRKLTEFRGVQNIVSKYVVIAVFLVFIY